jgi:hypothetical protein
VKPTETLIEHEGNLEPESTVDMSFDENSLQHLMSVMIDMYPDPELASIREIATNAWDSHRAAGNDAPIEIELPTQMRPVYVVRDHGVGLSVDDIENRFSKYGYSSKRGNDTEVGMLGLGCKAPLTYTNQFTIVAVQNGIKATALVTRKENGAGQIQVVDTCSTNLPNGVEVTIPVSNVETFRRKAQHFFQFWDPGSVLVNGQPLKDGLFDPNNPNTLMLDADVVIVRTGHILGSSSNYLVMGNVAYPFNVDFNDVAWDFRVIARVEIGSIDFPPARDAVRLTTRSKEVIKLLKEYVDQATKRHAQDEIDAAPTPFEALGLVSKWKHVFRRVPYLKYNGVTVPGTLGGDGYHLSCRHSTGSASRSSGFHAESLVNENTWIVFDHPKRSFDKETKERIKEKFPDAADVYSIFSIKDEDLIWLEGANVFSYDDVRPPKKERKRRDKTALAQAQTWWVSTDGKPFIESQTPTLCYKRIIYVTRSETAGGFTREHFRRNLSGDLHHRIGVEDVALVMLSSNEVDKFKKLHPHAETPEKFLRARFAEIEGLMSDDQKAWGTKLHPLGNFLPSEFEDPDLQAVVARVNACVSPKNQELSKERDYLVRYAYSLSPTRVLFEPKSGKSNLDARLEQWLHDYPLCKRVIGLDQTHVDYMNALYLYRKNEGKR